MKGEFGTAIPRGEAPQPQTGKRKCGQQMMSSSSRLRWASTRTRELMTLWGRRSLLVPFLVEGVITGAQLNSEEQPN